MTGHGGDGFLKFQDSEELTSMELANAFEQMHQKRRYNEILFIIDTCQAESMSAKIYSPNIIGKFVQSLLSLLLKANLTPMHPILGIGSSKVGEDSLSHHGDNSIGVYVIDRYTYYVLEFLEKYSPHSGPNSKRTLGDFLEVCPKRLCISTVSIRRDLYGRNPYQVPLSDFFGNVANLKMVVAPVSGQFNSSNAKVSNPKASTGQQPKSTSWNLVDPFPAVAKLEL